MTGIYWYINKIDRRLIIINNKERMKITLVMLMMLVSLTMNALVERRLRRRGPVNDCVSIVDAGSSGSRLYIFCKEGTVYV